MNTGVADHDFVSVLHQLEVALPIQEDTLKDLGVRRIAGEAQAQKTMNATEIPIALSNEPSDPARGARTGMALTTLIQFMEEGDEKIADMEDEISELQRELQVARAGLADVRAAFHATHNDVGASRQELATSRAELVGASREKIAAVVDVLNQTGLSQDMQIRCIKDIVTGPFNQPVPVGDSVVQRFWLMLVAMYDDAVKLSGFDDLAQNPIVVAFGKIIDFVVQVLGCMMLLLIMVALYNVLHPLPACPPGYVRVRY